MIRYSATILVFHLLIGQLTGQPPCDPPISIIMSVSGPVCAGGAVFIAFDLEDDDDENFDILYTIGGVNYTIEGIEDDITVEYVANFSTSVTLIQVLDNGNSCISVINQTLPITVTNVTVNSTVEDPDCGLMNGTINVQASAGTAPYTFSLNGGSFQNSGFFNGLGAGTYTIDVLDASGCTGSALTLLSPGSGPSLVISNQSNPACGVSNGSITVTASGGTAPYTFSINGGPFQGSGNFTGLGPGDFTIEVSDGNGCANTIFAQLSTSNAPSLVISNQSNPACGVSNGSITVTASGGTAPYTFSINGGPFQGFGNFTGLGPGIYAIEVKDVAGCNFILLETLSAENAPIISILDKQSPNCGQDDGLIVLTASGGNPPYLFSLNGGAFGTSGEFTNLSPGSFEMAVKDNNGCLSFIQTTLTDISQGLSAANITTANLFGCSSTTFTLSGNLPIGASGAWVAPTVPLSAPSSNFWQLDNLPPGNFLIYWTLSAPGCPSYSTDTVTVGVIPPPVANPDGIFSVFSGEQTDIDILINDDLLGSTDFRIIRQPTQGEVFWNGQSLAYQSDVGAIGADTVIYEVCYTACNAVCDTAIVLFFNLNNENPCLITADTSNIFTNGLTPNGDGSNDRLIFRIVSIEECEVNYANSEIKIYNRWGDIVFERSPYNNDWEGTYNGADLPPGVYYFVLRISLNGKVYSQFGSVIILR